MHPEPASSRGSLLRSEQYDAVLTGVATYRNNLPVIIDPERLKQFPFSSTGQEIIQVEKSIVAEKEPVKIRVTFSQRSADDFSMIVEVSGDTERSAQCPQHPSRTIFLTEPFYPPSLRVEADPGALRDVIDRQYVIPIVVEGPQVYNIKLTQFLSSFFTVGSCFHRSSWLHKTWLLR